MSQKSRHTGNVEIVALGASSTDSAADGTITLRPNVVITGDLTVQGATTSVNTTNTEIKDRIVTLNKGETGAGVTLDTSGIEIDRGTEDNAFLVFDEAVGGFKLEADGNPLKLTGVASPTEPYDAVNKIYLESVISGVSASQIYEDDTSVSISDPGTPGVVDITVDGTQTAQFNSSGLMLKNGSTQVVTDDDLTLAPNGMLIVNASTMFEYQASTPSADPAGVIVYADSADTGTQLRFKHSTGAGQLVSKRQAILYGLIF